MGANPCPIRVSWDEWRNGVFKTETPVFIGVLKGAKCEKVNETGAN